MILSVRTGGILLGLVFFAAVFLVKPIGVSTQFVILDGIVWDTVSPNVVTSAPEARSGYTSSNAYLNKGGGAYAKAVANPWNYSFIFVVAMMAGAWLSSRMRGGVTAGEKVMPAIWRANFGGSRWRRSGVAFVSGIIVLYGARLAGGCTSGHMMSGMMQTAVSGFVFTAGVFIAGVPLALFLFKKEA